MAKTFEILSVDEARSVLLIRFDDGTTTLDTEVPFPPDLNSPDPGDADLSEWIESFWPHTVMEAPTLSARLRTKQGLTGDITAVIPTPASTRSRRS